MKRISQRSNSSFPNSRFQFHQFYSPLMFIKMFFSDLIFALFLYQLTLSSTVSKVQLYKVLVEFFAFAFYLYSVCYVSEELDTCNVKIERAFGNSGWIKCSGKTCLDLCFLIRRVQRPNHLRFYEGFIVLSRSYYLKVVKASYSMVNFMRLNVN
uniref:Uncharacterized protein n=1 Tax=Cacopsylla melanoneura TaxID=428564 RepID=A0A8D8R8S4_9HEMI